jgi:hypothetical protein
MNVGKARHTHLRQQYGIPQIKSREMELSPTSAVSNKVSSFGTAPTDHVADGRRVVAIGEKTSIRPDMQLA